MNTIATISERLRHLSPRSLLLGLACGVALSVGATTLAQTTGVTGVHQHAATMTAQDMNDHIDEMLQHLYTAVDASDAQKAQLGPLLKQAVSDVHSIVATLGNTHTQVLNLLSADTVDPTAIEALRAAQMATVDQASKRIAQFVGETANVLTPAQRKALAAHIAQMHATAHQG